MRRLPSPWLPVLLELGAWCAILGALAGTGLVAMQVCVDLVQTLAPPILRELG